MTSVCAWCDEKMDRPAGNLRGEPALKHGLCDSCLEQMLRLLEPERVAA